MKKYSAGECLDERRGFVAARKLIRAPRDVPRSSKYT